jgi:putative phage-type endonuclease
MHDRETLTFDTEEQWLAMRREDLTSTESSALFGVSPYNTEYQLYHVKRGDVDGGIEQNERMKWGNRLEAAIAEGVAEDYGLIVETFKVYVRLRDRRIGSSFDYKIVGITDTFEGDDETYRDLFRQLGEGLLEIKNVDGFIFRKSWSEEDSEVEAPPHIEFQVQHQMLVSGLQWGVLAPLVNGNTPKPTYRVQSDKVHEGILKKAQAFWSKVDAGTPPEPDFYRDGDTIGKLLLDDDDTEEDMTDNQYLAQLCQEEIEAGIAKREAEKEQKAKKAEILTIIGHHRKVVVCGINVNAKTVKGSDGKTLTPDDIGERIGARKGGTRIRISQYQVRDNPGKVVDESMIGQKVGERKPHRTPKLTQPKPKATKKKAKQP